MFAVTHRALVHVRTASVIYVLSKNKKNITLFHKKNITLSHKTNITLFHRKKNIFTAVKIAAYCMGMFECIMFLKVVLM